MKMTFIASAALLAAIASAMTGCASFGDNFLAYTYVPDVMKWTTKSSDQAIYDRAYKCFSSFDDDAQYLDRANYRAIPGYRFNGPLPFTGKNEIYSQVQSHIYSSSLDITKNTAVNFHLNFSIHNKQAVLTVDKVQYLDTVSKVSAWKPLWNKVQTDSMTENAVYLEKIVQQCIGE